MKKSVTEMKIWPEYRDLLDLTKLENGKSAEVLEVKGEYSVVQKLNVMGIIPGSTLVKKSTTLMKGPIVLEMGDRQFAIGYDLAQKIIVKTPILAT